MDTVRAPGVYLCTFPSAVKGFAAFIYTCRGAAVSVAFRSLKGDWALNVQLRHIQKIPPKIPRQMKESQETLAV